MTAVSAAASVPGGTPGGNPPIRPKLTHSTASRQRSPAVPWSEVVSVGRHRHARHASADEGVEVYVAIPENTVVAMYGR